MGRPAVRPERFFRLFFIIWFFAMGVSAVVTGIYTESLSAFIGAAVYFMVALGFWYWPRYLKRIEERRNNPHDWSV